MASDQQDAPPEAHKLAATPLPDEADSLEAGAGKQPTLSKPAAMARSCNSCSGLWQTVGQVYAQLLLALAAVSSLQQPGPARSAGAHLQWYVLVWCHAGGAAVITCCYVRLVTSGAPADKLGSLRRAHRAAGQHAFLRAAAAVLGLAALAEGALEAVVHAGCGGDAQFTAAVLRALFTFLQMHFLFIDSQQVVVGGAGALARLGSAHLVAANVAPCLLAALNMAVAAVAAPGDTSPTHGAESGECALSSLWGRLWHDCRPFLQPVAVQFSVVAALATYASARPASRRPAVSALDAAAPGAASAAPTSSSSAPRLPAPLRGGGCCCGGGAARGLWAGLPLVVGAAAACALRLQPAPGVSPPPALLSEGARAAALSAALMATVLAATALRAAPVSRLHRRLSRLDAALLCAGQAGLQVRSAGAALWGAARLAAGAAPGAASLSLLTAAAVADVAQAWAQHAVLALGGGAALGGGGARGRAAAAALLCCNAALWVVAAAAPVAQIEDADVWWECLERTASPLWALFRLHSAVLLLAALARGQSCCFCC